MSTTTKQDESFSSDMEDYIEVKVSKSALENAIEWIRKNLDPDDVFEEDKLLKFAAGYIPTDVFPEADLIDWAENNGYVKG
jgi:hypothetical protein